MTVPDCVDHTVRAGLGKEDDCSSQRIQKTACRPLLPQSWKLRHLIFGTSIR